MSNTEISNPKYALEELLKSDKFARKIKAVLDKPGQAERFVQIGLNALIRQPQLRECTQASVITALLRLSQIGLEPDGYHAHLVPFNSKSGKQVQLIIDYKGLMTVIRRNPNITVMKGNVIYQKDKISYREGSDRYFSHEPTYLPPDKDNPVIGAYSFVKYRDGDWDVDIMPVWKIELTRERSKAKDDGPWLTDYDEMAIKTVIRHHSKRLPLRPEEREAVTADDDQFEFNPFDHDKKTLPETSPKFEDEDETETKVEPKSAPRTEARVQKVDRSPQPRGAENPKPDRKVEEVREPDRREDRGAEAEQNPFDGAAEPATQPARPAAPARPSPHVVPKPAESMVAAVREVASTEEQAHPSTKGQKLLALINRNNTTQVEVIAVLTEHDIDVGKARESGLIEDFPDETMDLAIRQWGSIQFSLSKRAK